MSPTEILILCILTWSLILNCCCSHPYILTLERIILTNVNLTEVIVKDHIRHANVIRGYSVNGVFNFPLKGSSDPYTFGLYFTRVTLGNPAREYNLLIDTGSDITWINCVSCTGCPSKSGLIEMSVFDPVNSSSATLVSCSDHTCKSVAQADRCSSKSLCSYSIPYGDGSDASGYYVSDKFQFETFFGNSKRAITSVDIIFGCSNNELGHITDEDKAVDGIFGLGHQPISIISQLASRGIAPNVFSHCLKGDAIGGGILVLGEVVVPGMVYTPLVLSEYHYNVNLLSISVGGKTVPIDPKVFSTSNNRGGTIVDSGTTYTYLSAEAFDPFVTALSASLPPSVSSFSYQGNQCFIVSSTTDAFPQVSLNFVGGASMVLKPHEYLIQVGFGEWCVGFQKSESQNIQGFTILGDLVLKDKVIVYDLARQRLGWVNYNCSSSVNVSFVAPKVSSSSRKAVLYHRLIPITAVGFIVYISMFAGIWHL